MSKPKAPAAPNPYDTARAQWQFGNFNQNTPWGSVNLTAPANGQPGRLDLTLSPEQQRQLDLRNQLTEGALTQAVGRQGQLNNLPGLTSQLDFSRIRGLTDDFSADRQRVERAYFDRARGLLDPVFADQERALRGTMADQGLPAGSEARNYDLGQFFDQRNQAFSRAAQEAILAGGDEQSRLFDMNMQAREAEIGDQLQNANLASTSRATLFNELQALLGQQQVAQPGLQNFHAPQGGDFLGAAALNQAAQNQQFMAQQDLYSGMLGGLFNLGSSWLAGGGGNPFGGLFGGAAGGAGNLGGAGSALTGALGGGSAAGGSAGSLGSAAGGLGSIGGGAAAGGLGSLAAGAQAGALGGITGTTAATEAALLGGAAPSLATGTGSGLLGLGGAGTGGAAGSAGGAAASGLSLGAAAGVLGPLAVLGYGLNNQETRFPAGAKALDQLGVIPITTPQGGQLMRLPNGEFIKWSSDIVREVGRRWGHESPEQIMQWLMSMPRISYQIPRIGDPRTRRRLPGDTGDYR